MNVSLQSREKMALITGASSGIGEAFARRLAADGYGLILIARRVERLQQLANELSDCHRVNVQVRPADLALDDDVSQVAEQIRLNGEVDLLVNNAGFGLVGKFVDVGIEEHLRMLQVHITASMRLAHACLPAMILRGSGGIINVSSVAAFLPWGNITYHSTKAFLVEFSRALHDEVSGKGIRIQALCPGFTITEFHDSEELSSIRRMALPKFLWHQPSYIVKESIKALERDRVVCIPGLAYRLIVAVGSSAITRPLFKSTAARVRKTAR